MPRKRITAPQRCAFTTLPAIFNSSDRATNGTLTDASAVQNSGLINVGTNARIKTTPTPKRRMRQISLVDACEVRVAILDLIQSVLTEISELRKRVYQQKSGFDTRSRVSHMLWSLSVASEAQQPHIDLWLAALFL